MAWERFTGVFVRGAYTEATGFGYLIPADWAGLDYESARDATPVWYGVSSGNGNDGVSQMYPDYYVRTAAPYRLAELAMVDQFKPESMAWAKSEVQVDGERDYTIQAVLYEDPDGCPAYGGGAWMLVDVFSVESDSNGPLDSNGPEYDRLESAFSEGARVLCG